MSTHIHLQIAALAQHREFFVQNTSSGFLGADTCTVKVLVQLQIFCTLQYKTISSRKMRMTSGILQICVCLLLHYFQRVGNQSKIWSIKINTLLHKKSENIRILSKKYE